MSTQAETCYLVLRKKQKRFAFWPGVSVRALSKKPTLHPDEIAVRLRITYDEALFERPQIAASLTLDENLVQTAEVEVEQQEPADA